MGTEVLNKNKDFTRRYFDFLNISMLLPKQWKLTTYIFNDENMHFENEPDIIFSSDDHKNIFTLSKVDTDFNSKDIEFYLKRQHVLLTKTILKYQEIGTFQKTIDKIKIGCIIYKSDIKKYELFNVLYMFFVNKKMCVGIFTSKYENYESLNDIALRSLESIQLIS